MFTDYTPRFIIPATAAETSERFYLRDTSGWWVGCKASANGTFGQHCRFVFKEELDEDGQSFTVVFSETLSRVEREEINRLPIIWWYTLYSDDIKGTWMVMQCMYSIDSDMMLNDQLGQTGV